MYNFPNTLSYQGKNTMRKIYSDLFRNTPDLHCKIKNRIIIGNKVIDEELVTMNNGKFSVVAIYEVTNGKMAKVTFIR